MKILRPEFCTTVLPEEYDYIGQWNEAIKAANKFHRSFVIREECPPPYYPYDMGKVYGLVKFSQDAQEQLTDAREVIEMMNAAVSGDEIEAAKSAAYNFLLEYK